MNSATADRDMDKLHPVFREKIEPWLAAVRRQFTQYDILVTEVFRSKERQQYLYNQGRTAPGAVVTWTLQSVHEFGMAIDWVPTQSDNLLYDVELYQRIYAGVPPARFGMETLAPREYPHIQIVGGQDYAKSLGIRENQIIGSTWNPSISTPAENPQGVDATTMNLNGHTYDLEKVSLVGDKLWVRTKE
ncbi:MAG: M15 family metallopeptidase [Shewanella sp.]